MNFELKVITGIFAVLVAAIAACVYFGIKADNEWARDCVAKGGYVVKDTDTTVGTGTVVTSGGKVGTVTTTSTTTDAYCISQDDGRILEIR